MNEKEEYMDHRELSLELLKSIREIDCRIDELKIILGSGPCPGQPERRQKVVDRVERLVETRFCLVYSFMDLNPSLHKKNPESINPFDTLQIEYKHLKRNI